VAVDNPAPTTCYRHPDRATGVTCQRCDRHICNECMRTASVGFHCPECTAANPQVQPTVAMALASNEPVVTRVLVGINVAVSVLAVLLSGSLLSLSNQVLVDWAAFGPAVEAGEWYRLVSSAFLHDGPLHLGFNMFALAMIGQQLERVFGPVRYLGIYVGSLVGGAFGIFLLSPDAYTVGASGAVFGLFGAAAVAQRFAGVNPWESGLGVVLGLNLLITFTIPNISIGGHVGGLIAGVIVASVLGGLARTRRPMWMTYAFIGVWVVALTAGSIWVAGIG